MEPLSLKTYQKFLKEGEQADVPVLIGSTADEATPFDPKMLSPQLASMSYKRLTHLAIDDMLPEVDSNIYDLYPIDTEEIAKKSWIDFQLMQCLLLKCKNGAF